MNDAIDGIGGGGPTSLMTYFSVLFPTGLFLIFLALPRQGWTKPEEPLPPGALWASIVIAGGIGAIMIHLPALLVSLLPISASFTYVVSVIMFVWFAFMCAMTLRRGSPYEADIIGSFIHKMTPTSFQQWRPREDMQRDVFLGIFIGWLSWMAEPSLVAQGVGAAALNGGMGSSLRFFSPRQRVDRWNHHSCPTIHCLMGRAIFQHLRPYRGRYFRSLHGTCLASVSLWATTNSVLAPLDRCVLEKPS